MLSVQTGARPKEWLINFPLIYNGQGAKLTWPQVTDIKIMRYAFYRYLLLSLSYSYRRSFSRTGAWTAGLDRRIQCELNSPVWNLLQMMLLSQRMAVFARVTLVWENDTCSSPKNHLENGRDELCKCLHVKEWANMLRFAQKLCEIQSKWGYIGLFFCHFLHCSIATLI